jgi:hypothetical protein
MGVGAAFCWLLIAFTYSLRPGGSILMFVVLATAGVALALPTIRALQRQRTDEAGYLGGRFFLPMYIVAAMVLAILHRKEVLYWPTFYTYIPLAFALTATALGVSIIEVKRRLRVYWTREGYVYVPRVR